MYGKGKIKSWLNFITQTSNTIHMSAQKNYSGWHSGSLPSTFNLELLTLNRLTVDLSQYNNSWYKPGSSFKRACWYLVNIIFFKTALFPFYGLKRGLLRVFGAVIGKGVMIKPHVNIKYPWLLTIGNHVWIGEQAWIDNLGQVTIGNHVCISQGAMLLGGNHDFTKANFDLIVKPIILDDGVWIGAKATIVGGVHCYSHSVLALGSVATADMDAYGIYQGNPAVKVKERFISKTTDD